MSPGWTPLIALHALGATLAVVLGGYLVLRRRRGDLLHRRIGRVWMVDMYWVVASSFGIKRLTPGHFSWIHGLSLWTAFSLTMAIVAARRRQVPQHRGWVIGTYCGLLGAGIAAVAFPVRLVPQTAVHRPGVLLLALLGVTAVAAVAIETAARLPARKLGAELAGATRNGVDDDLLGSVQVETVG
jgi:uncharacterized membrane protein